MRYFSSGKAIAAMVLILFAAGTIAYTRYHRAPDDSAPAPSVLVTELRLTPASMPATLTAYGSIQPGFGGETTIVPQASGILGSLAVTAGEHVEANQVLAVIYPDALSVADAQKAASAMRAAKSNVAHVSALRVAHLATDADVAVAAQTLRDAQSALAALRVTGSGVQRVITAPFAGIITGVLAAPGAAFAGGTPLLRIADAARLVASVGLPPAQAGQVSVGDRVQITLLDTGHSLSASVTSIGAMLDPQTGLLALQIGFGAPADVMLNQPVAAAIMAQMIAGYVVPRDAVQTDDAGDFVYQVDARNIARRTPVKIRVKAAQQTLIAANLDANMPVVVTGAMQLADGMAVRTAP